MDKLTKGVVEFREKDFIEHKDLFDQLKQGQKPHTLFIACSDSRVIPSLITKTLPGELFIIRNIGNIIPPWRVTSDYVATTSAIEYAVNILHVENIVVCGHSNCGACETLFYENNELDAIPSVKKWLELIAPVKEKVEKVIASDNPNAKEWLAEQINVVEQLEHLLTYPYIKEKYQKGSLTIQGWHYIIETGEVYNYDREKGYFELATN